jgi:hypothetical protein
MYSRRRRQWPSLSLSCLGVCPCLSEVDYRIVQMAKVLCAMAAIGRAHTTGENGEWGETKQRSENQVAFNSILGPS